ncbi:UNVERIFIED_CONTAM: hypothetical protein GTU68_017335 [Idotea baltica]|nr:hypothetical protein [Idotea baltica]
MTSTDAPLTGSQAPEPSTHQKPVSAVVPKQYLFPFILTTCCFALWGFANDFTNPLVKVYERVFIIPTAQASWLQFAFYFGYFCMALPAVFFIRKFSYKAAILLGLSLYAAGSLIAIPGSLYLSFPLLVLGSYIIPCGLAFLETACNPYILAMGPPETATQRLNLAQAFNPMGSLTGMAVATFILAPALLTDSAVAPALKGFSAMEPEAFKDFQGKDLANVRGPYITIAVIVVIFFLIFALSRMPSFDKEEKDAPFLQITHRILKRTNFVGGVIAQGVYVGAQIMCWTYIVHYGIEQCGLTLGEAQTWNMASMVLFLSSRFVCTFLLRTISPGKLLTLFAAAGFFFVVGAILLEGRTGLTCLVCVSGCMSLMFPTIYGIALSGMEEEESKLGSAFLIMSIVGGAIGAKFQGGMITDYGVRSSFWLVAACFVVVTMYGIHTFVWTESKSETVIS